MEFNKKEAYKIYLDNESLTDATKQWCMENGVEYEDRFMHRLKRYVKSNEDDDYDTETVTVTNQYANDIEEEEVMFMPSAWDPDINRFLSIDEYCEKYGLDKESVRSSKLVAHNAGHMIYNIAFNSTVFGEEGLDESCIEDIVNKLVQPIQSQIVPVSPEYSGWFDRLVYTDTHVGMDVNSDGDPLYDGIWDRAELMKRLDILVEHTLKHKKSDTLVIDDLGDFLDGFDGNTTRKGHILPQNMNNKECFEVGLEFKIRMVDMLVDKFNHIYCNNICNDNHSGDWGYVVNHAFKLFIEQKYPEQVTVNNHKRFMNHYKVGKHTFVISHGKDKEALKFGFKPVLDAKGYEKIDQYCKEHSLYNGNYIEFGMGDQHQYISDYTSSNDFCYIVYPALSPPSNWVKSNFKKSKSGFVLYNVDPESQTKVCIPYIFEKQKV